MSLIVGHHSHRDDGNDDDDDSDLNQLDRYSANVNQKKSTCKLNP